MHFCANCSKRFRIQFKAAPGTFSQYYCPLLGGRETYHNNGDKENPAEEQHLADLEGGIIDCQGKS